jgi:hypothetical protein
LDQRPNEQPSVGLDPHHDLGRLLDVLGHHRVEPTNPAHVVAHLAFGEHLPLAVHDADVVMGLGPIYPDENHSTPPFPCRSSSREEHAAS